MPPGVKSENCCWISCIFFLDSKDVNIKIAVLIGCPHHVIIDLSLFCIVRFFID